jgi:drug/metabolite transporter (DMT)-like permease
MRHPVLWVFYYSVAMACAQVLMKMGTNRIGEFAIKQAMDIFPLLLKIALNPFIFGGVVLLVSSFFLWLYIISFFQLALIFPLTAMIYVFVEVLSYFILGEKLLWANYGGIALIALGIFFLLYKY